MTGIEILRFAQNDRVVGWGLYSSTCCCTTMEILRVAQVDSSGALAGASGGGTTIEILRVAQNDSSGALAGASGGGTTMEILRFAQNDKSMKHRLSAGVIGDRGDMIWGSRSYVVLLRRAASR